MAVDADLKIMFKFVANLIKTSKNTDIKKIQKEIGANQNRVVAFNVTTMRNKQHAFYFQITDGKLHWFPNDPGRVDMNIYTSTETMLNIFDGRKRVLDHKTNQVIFAPYTPLDAFSMQDIWGDSNLSLTDVKAFVDIFNKEVEGWRKITGPIRSEKY